MTLQDDNFVLTPLLGGSIGRVSGVKGGAAAGTIIGATALIDFALSNGPWGFVIFAAILGMTTGLMMGATIGFFYGIICGAISGFLTPEVDQTGAAKAVWYAVAIILFVITGYLVINSSTVLGLMAGAIAGVINGRISQQDFQRVVIEQTLPPEDEPKDEEST